MSFYESSLGSFIIGTFFSVWSAGVAVNQAYNYFSAGPTSRLNRWTVGVLTVLVLIEASLCVRTIYVSDVTEYGNLFILATVPWSFTAVPLLTGALGLSYVVLRKCEADLSDRLL